MKIQTYSEKETYTVGQNIAKNIKPGSIVCLYGDLGAGKTVITKGIANGLNIRANVNSPTFIILKVYPVGKNKKLKNFCHIDAYRLQSKEQALSIGLNEYLANEKNISIIEWPKNIEGILRKFKDKIIKIKITFVKNHPETRNIEIKYAKLAAKRLALHFK